LEQHALPSKKRSVRRILAVLAAVVTSLGVAIPVLAAYLGPNRTVVTHSLERKQCVYTADGDYGGQHWGCHMSLYFTPSGTCPGSVDPGYFNTKACGWPAGVSCGTMSCSYGGPYEDIVSCSSGEQGCTSVDHSTTYPEATVAGSVACPLYGSNGWCVRAANLSLTSNEPVAGYGILTLEGTRNGVSFLIGGGSGSVPLLEGVNTFTFWALSS
jgi:hypothetical protein